VQYVLDTNTCIYAIKKRPPSVVRRLTAILESDPSLVAISSVTLSELEYGVQKSADPTRNRLALAGFLTPLQILSYDDRAAQTYGWIRALLERRGALIGPLDMLIAAHALCVEATLVTDNEREFRRVPGLRVENWASRTRASGRR
jgi:tRNA(fMet)-specific endonuclease VapC